jgi:diguanylate cyclase (GGDEF)-like protein
MSDWLLIRARRVKIAEFVLYLLLVMAVALFITDLLVGLPGDYRLGLLMLPLVPAVIFLSRYYDLSYIPNLAAIAIVFAYVIYHVFAEPAAPFTVVLFVIAPMVFFFLTNLHIGTLLSVLLLLIHAASFALASAGDGVVGLELFIQGLAAYIVASVLAWLYERDWLAIEARLLVNSDIDFLTQVHNRRGLIRMLQKSMADALRYRHELAVIMFDVDEFEQLIERHGRHASDQLLIELAGLIGRHVRAGDSLGRWNAERFMLLAPNTGLVGANQFAEKLRRLMKSYYFEGIGHITASLGVVVLEHDSLDGLLEKVEQAVNQAKRHGNAVHVMEP